MRIDKLHIQNFRKFNELTIKFNPQFTLLIGENGSGKTAILEATSIAISSFFLGLQNVPSRNIRDEDIHLITTLEGSTEYSYTTAIKSDGFINGKLLRWEKERRGISANTLYHPAKGQILKTERDIFSTNSYDKEYHSIKHIAQDINKEIKNPTRTNSVNLPLLVYYSTGRLWKEGWERKDKEDDKIKNIPSRYRGYKNALETSSYFKIMLEWFRRKYLAIKVKDEETFQLNAVKSTIIKNIPGCIDIFWEFDPDKINTLMIKFETDEVLPFSYLSDGYRNLLAIFADIAYRCVTLNPHFKEEAANLSDGIVLIDEIDLHLHPQWQKEIVKKLRGTFPKLQFIATTHSPFIIQEMDEGELFRLEDNHISVLGANQLSIEDIAKFLQGIEEPHWSKSKEQMYDAAKKYFQVLEELSKSKSEAEINQKREELNLIGRPYSENVAYIAFLEQKRTLVEEKLKNK